MERDHEVVTTPRIYEVDSYPDKHPSLFADKNKNQLFGVTLAIFDGTFANKDSFTELRLLRFAALRRAAEPPH